MKVMHQRFEKDMARYLCLGYMIEGVSYKRGGFIERSKAIPSLESQNKILNKKENPPIS